MSRYLGSQYDNLEPYVPGEQPQDRSYIKLNTNESPFPPPKSVFEAAKEASRFLNLYNDPDNRRLTEAIARNFNLSRENVMVTNGSDEALNYAFMAYCDNDHPIVFPDITYGFYKVFAEINRVPYTEIPLREDFTVNVDDYVGIGKNIFLANPNAPTGIALPLSDIERIVASNPDNIVVIDEAYVDFGGESAVLLIKKYDNLIVTQTFSKSRSMAGARLGFGVACEALIRDMNTVKYSTNPYNINRMTMAAGLGTLEDETTVRERCREIIETRDYTVRELTRLGFEMTDSRTNFVFARHKSADGGMLYEKLKKNGILVRHFTSERIKEYNRITVGSRAQMETLIKKLEEILK